MRVIVFLLGFSCVLSLVDVNAYANNTEEALFENQIRPVLVEICFRCHGDSKISGGLRVDSRDALLTGGESGAAIAPGAPQTSLLIKAIRRHHDVSPMPPEKEMALRPEQVAAFESWIRASAPWPKSFKKFEKQTHWAFEPIPAVDPSREWKHPSQAIDAFLRDKQQSAGVGPVGRADKITLIRRATFDLTGLPPTPDEVTSFEQDQSPSAFRTLVDRLLDSPEYGKRWGRHWLDVVRYADTAGETADYPVPMAWRYRNYVIDAFNADKPYDQFLHEQIAGDILAEQSAPDRFAELITATGYLAISRRFGFDSENYHHLTIQDTIDNLGQTFMGLSLGCARCHDHKFDAVTTKDYYGMYAIFDSSRYAFPGSEQKQKIRSMAPLVPPMEALPKWQAFEQRVAMLASSLEKRKQPVPTAILRSLCDMDGDFEMQAPAAGGSNGVLVPPWLYEGKIAITNAAQSPFKNRYLRGQVGASITADAGEYRISQAIHLRRGRENIRLLNLNLDFRVAPDSKAMGSHQFWIGSADGSAPFIVSIKSDSVSVQNGESIHQLGTVVPSDWHNLQLHVDISQRTLSSRLANKSGVQTVDNVLLDPVWSGALELFVLKSSRSDTNDLPAIEFDNLAVQENTIPPATLQPPSESIERALLDETELTRQLNELVGLGGDFESQTEGKALQHPWNAGPNSVVKISSNAQSTFESKNPRGRLGLSMPNRTEYDGFGVKLLNNSSAQSTERLFARFDFRVVDIAIGGDGSWRFYLGHGPGNSAAVELFINGKQFFRRSGDARDAVSLIAVGDWNQVQLELDLKAKTYKGTLLSGDSCQPFHGEFATGWDGSIDYSFIDGYGHLGGVRPALDVDNYEIRNSELTSNDKNIDVAERHEKANLLRQQIEMSKAETEADRNELNKLLAEGPFAMAYGMSEGTPHDVRIQLRGEPSQPGETVSRGFVRAMGGTSLPTTTAGSGRLELARWLTSPENPTTARVMVNRLWHYHFGQGLVKTPNDLGVRGNPPTLPELLDELARQFLESGWSIKAMHRAIMFSDTYQRSSIVPPSADEMDARDLYTRFSRRRLSAEEIRDSILMVSGELDRDPGKEHPFPTPIDWGYTQHRPFTAVYDHNKRSVYLMTQRLKRHPYLALFDGADPNATTADRLGTTVPTQALYFLNDPFIHAKSEAWAKRLRNSCSTTQECIERAFQTAFGRTATSNEQVDAINFLAAYESELATVTKEPNLNLQTGSIAAFLRTLFASNEFLYVD